MLIIIHTFNLQFHLIQTFNSLYHKIYYCFLPLFAILSWFSPKTFFLRPPMTHQHQHKLPNKRSQVHLVHVKILTCLLYILTLALLINAYWEKNPESGITLLACKVIVLHSWFINSILTHPKKYAIFGTFHSIMLTTQFY